MALARYGLKEQPTLWQPTPPEARKLNALSTRLAAIGKDLQREKNRQEKVLATDTPGAVLNSIRQMATYLETEQQGLECLVEGTH